MLANVTSSCITRQNEETTWTPSAIKALEEILEFFSTDLSHGISEDEEVYPDWPYKSEDEDLDEDLYELLYENLAEDGDWY